MPSEPSLNGNGVAVALRGSLQQSGVAPGRQMSGNPPLHGPARAMEERMIKMSKSGQGYFWIGGPGEEVFNTCLGLQVKKGQGPDYDYLHLHYRNSATLVAMGMPLKPRGQANGHDRQ